MRFLLFTFSILIFATSFSQDVHVNGYYRSNGTYVQPHYRSEPNNTNSDNFSTVGNVNPYTGQSGNILSDGGTPLTTFKSNDYEINNSQSNRTSTYFDDVELEEELSRIIIEEKLAELRNSSDRSLNSDYQNTEAPSDDVEYEYDVEDFGEYSSNQTNAQDYQQTLSSEFYTSSGASTSVQSPNDDINQNSQTEIQRSTRTSSENEFPPLLIIVLIAAAFIILTKVINS